MTFKEIKRKIKSKCVGIAGAGGLGSNCAVALARVGVGKIIIADFDKITKENLNRQYFFIDQIGQKKVFALSDNIDFINPEVTIVTNDVILDPGKILEIYKECDVIIEAFDDAAMKQMIIETVQSHWPEKPLIIGSGMAGWGDNSSIKCRKIDNLYICGDEKSEISDEMPPLAPRVGIVAHLQANIALEILLT
ncbi:MAG: sulfur carrier protein ThiS adenylyltransferase ThiF [Bacteroidales bacterium]